MILGMSRRLIDPRTREATAFYAALGVTLWDILQKGFNPYSVAILAAMAGIGVLGALGMVLKPPGPEDRNPPKNGP